MPVQLRNSRIGRTALFLVFLGSFLILIPGGPAGAQDKKKVLQIGMSESFFSDMPAAFTAVFTAEFKLVLKKALELDGDLDCKHDAVTITKKLDRKELDFALLHGHEFAWLQKDNPDLKPVVVAQGKNPAEEVYLVVHKDCAATSIADLRGKKIDIPAGSKAYCRVFLDRLCADNARSVPAMHFSAMEKSESPAAGLDAVCRQKCDAVLVDGYMLEFYKDVRGPVFDKHLRVLKQSEAFPHPIIVYKEGRVDEATVKHVREGMLKVHTNFLGRSLMTLAKFEQFVPMTDGYAKQLESVRASYPAPSR